MDDNNSFLNAYKKNMEEKDTDQPAAPAAPAVPERQTGLRYEEKSGFVAPRKKDTGLPPPPKRPKWIVPVVIGAILLAGIVITLLLLLNQGVSVMDFTGWQKNQVQLWANENGVNLQFEEAFDDAVEEGKIVSQSVAKDAKVKKGDFIKLVVSKGHDLTVALDLPDLMNMTKEEVEAWAEQNFMTKVRITAEFSDTVASGKVIRFEINDNTVVDQVRRNTPIYVIVSKGREDLSAVTVTIPDFKEKTIAESYIFANENGLVLKVIEQYDDYVPKGSIIAQSVKVDEKVPKGTEITLNVSKGKLIEIPDFSGYSKEKATAVATELGIPLTIKEKYSSSSAGRMISQSLEPDTEYEAGDILELTYSLGNKIVLPSFVGQTQDAMETWAKEYNLQGAKISVKVTTTQSNAAKGTIIHQDPVNKSIGVKATIKITVSKGKVVYVPDFVRPDTIAPIPNYNVAITREEAIEMCEALNLVPVFEKASKYGRLAGEVWYQSIKAGTETAEGTKITLKYVPSKTVKVPRFIALPWSEKSQAEILAAFGDILDITFVEEYKDGKEGQIFKQSLSPMSTVASGTAITLTIGAAEPTS